MLVEFRVKNYRSIAEEVCLSMVAGRGSELQSNTFEVPEIRQRLLRSVVLFGANGSGKSTVLAAMRLLHLLVSHSATRLEPDDEIPTTPFLLDSTLTDQPTRFEISFVADLSEADGEAPSSQRSLFRYALAVTRERVVEELLEAWPKGRLQVWYHRKDGQPIDYPGKNLQGDKRQIERLTRPNATYLSTAAQHNHPQLKQLHKWFQRRLRYITPVPDGAIGLLSRQQVPDSISAAPFTAVQAKKEPEFLRLVTEALRQADVGIDSLQVESASIETKFPAEIVSKLTELGMPKGEVLEVHTGHRRRDGEIARWAMEQESGGTQQFFELIGPWLDVLRNNFVLGVDEPFGALHPALTQRLLNMLHHGKVSTAQVILISHDVTLLDQGLFRRDQVWFTEKTEGATALFSLADFDDKPRKGEAQLVQKYLLGKFGGVPLGGPFVLGHRTPRPAAVATTDQDMAGAELTVSIEVGDEG